MFPQVYMLITFIRHRKKSQILRFYVKKCYTIWAFNLIAEFYFDIIFVCRTNVWLSVSESIWVVSKNINKSKLMSKNFKKLLSSFEIRLKIFKFLTLIYNIFLITNNIINTCVRYHLLLAKVLEKRLDSKFRTESLKRLVRDVVPKPIDTMYIYFLSDINGQRVRFETVECIFSILLIIHLLATVLNMSTKRNPGQIDKNKHRYFTVSIN